MSETTDTQTAGAGDTASVATLPNTTGDMVPATKEMVAQWLAGEDLVEEDDTPVIDLEDALRILSADNPAEVLRVDEMRDFDTLDGVAFVVLQVTWRKSTKQGNGNGRYAVMRCVDGTGEQFLTTCGATKVILQLRWAQLHAALPWQVQARLSETDGGNTVKELEAPAEPF